MRRACADAISHGLDRALRNTGGATPQEPDLVYGFLQASVPLLADAFRKALPREGIATSVAGIFCHKKPLVGLLDSEGGGCELGDLLLVFEYRDRSGLQHNALLLQAKRGARFPRRTRRPQWRLYNEWPHFEYREGSRQKREIEPPRPHAGGQYCLFTACPICRPRGTCPHYTVRAREADSEATATPLAATLLDAMLFRTGRSFSHQWTARDEAKGGWDEMIWDLLERAAQVPVRLVTSEATGDPASDLRIQGGLLAPTITLSRDEVPQLLRQAGFSFDTLAAPDDLARMAGSGPPAGSSAQNLDGEDEVGAVPALVVEIATDDSIGLWD